MTDAPDAELLEQFARNDSEAAFAELVRRHLALVHSVALRHTADAQHAQDITQAVFIILARKAPSLRRKTVLSGWLYHTARLTAANFRRSEARRIRREQETFMQSTLDETPSDEVWSEIAPMLDEAMSRLGRTDRDAIVLRYFENKNLREVGAALGLRERAAQKRVARSLEKLRAFFARRGVVSTTAIVAGAISANSVQAVPVSAVLTKSVTAVAIAKGAAVSASTLTLINGALKIMAWTKAKTAIVTGIALVLLGGMAELVISEIKAQPTDDSQPTIDESFWKADSRVLDKVPPVLIIRPTKFPVGAGGLDAGDKAVWMHASITNLLAIAYGFSESNIVLANQSPKEYFDLMLTLPRDSKKTLQNEIKRRFGLVGHTETVFKDVLSLKLKSTNAPGLKPIYAPNATSLSEPPGEGGRWWVLPKTTLSLFTIDLEVKLKQEVRDQTGLKGNFEIKLRWQAKDGESENEAFKRAVLEQLGLDLVPIREPTQILIVEKAR